MIRRHLLIAALAGGAGLAFPAASAAHGVVQRANLPIPEWLFGWAAAVVLIVSFVALAALWPQPRLEEPRWKPLPAGRALGSPALETACGLIGVLLLAVVIAAGLEGHQSGGTSNFATTFVFIQFWVGLAFASVLFGDIFRAFSPWRLLGRPFKGIRAYPERLGRWPAAAGLLVFTWIELVSGWGGSEPDTIAYCAIAYTLYTLAAQYVYGTETWTDRGETFAVYFGLLSRISIFERRDGVVGRRPFLGGLPQLQMLPGTVAVVLVSIGTVTFDGLEQGRLWKNLEPDLADALGVDLAATVGFLAGVAIVSAFYWLGIKGAATVGEGHDEAGLRRRFAHSLVPIAFAYVAAHYLGLLVFESQAISFLASDPFARGWDIFGTADADIDFGVLSQNLQWYLQVACVVAGHVAALVLAHDRALAIYTRAREAVRSQYWMLGIMVGFTTLALWLLAEAGKR